MLMILRRQLPQLTLISLVLIIILNVTEAQSDIQTENGYMVPNAGTILMIGKEDVWEIDPETGTIKQQYDKQKLLLPSSQSFVDHKNNFLYTIRKLSEDIRPTFGKFGVVQINLKTGEEKILFEGENPFAIAPHPIHSNQLIVSYFESSTPQKQMRSNPQYCFLNLQTLNCKEMNIHAIPHFFLVYGYFPIYWLDEENFLAGGGTKVNAFTGEAKPLLPDWVLFTLAPQYGVANILVVAKPRNEFNDVENIVAGFYTLDLKNLTFSKKLADTRPFDKITPPSMSANKKFAAYSSSNRIDGQIATVIDLNAGKVVFESQNTTLIWLPNSNNLVGAIYLGDPRHSTIIRVDAETGQVTKLFEMDDQVNFTVVQ